MKTVTYNIRYGLGRDNRIDLARTAAAVRGADIIGLQEVERFWRRSGMTDQPALLGALLPDYYWTYCPAFDVDAGSRDDAGKVLNRRRQFGPMLLSRWPILSTRRLVLPRFETVDLFNFNSGAIEGVINTPAGALRVYSLHLSSVSSRERMVQIDALLHTFARACTFENTPTSGGAAADPGGWHNGEEPPPTPVHAILMGDFNSVAESAEYIRFAGEIDPIYGRGVHADNLLDSWSVARETSGEPITWRPDSSDSPHKALRLDYCFVSAGLRNKVARAWVDTDADGSDHQPYWMELDV